MKVCMFLLFVLMLKGSVPSSPVTIDYRMDESLWTSVIGDGASESTEIRSMPDGKHYLSVDLYGDDTDDSRAALYTSPGSDLFPSGTTEDDLGVFWLEFDFRFAGGSTNAGVLVGLFNSAGDNDGDPELNCCGVQLCGSDVMGVKVNEAGTREVSRLTGNGSNVLHRVKAVFYSHGGQVWMDIRLYRIDDRFELWKIGQIHRAVLMEEGESFAQGLDALGVRNMPSADPVAHAQYDIDNIYFSTEQAQSEVLTPSFAPLSVRAVFENDGLTYFDPWNTNRWAVWYSNIDGTNFLAQPFALDCDVSLEFLGETWEPDISHLTVDYLFYLGNAFKGKTFKGNGVAIDVSKPTARQLSISQLYNDPDQISETDRFPLQHCFYVRGSEADLPATVIEDLWIYGFATSIFTEMSCLHPLHVNWVNIRRGVFGMYLNGQNTTVSNGSFKQNSRGGIYLDMYSSSNTIRGVKFEDNNYDQRPAYGDLAVDSSYGNVFEGNIHVSTTDPDHRLNAAYKLYRNSGEDDVLRENPSGPNIYRNNTISDYDVGFDVGSRMGREGSEDLSGEGRDYAPNNIFENNIISDTEIGIKINCSYTTVDGNTFSGVTYPVLLHCIWNSLTDIYIYNQDGTRISYWFMNSEWTSNSSYATWFPYQDDWNSGIAESEKYIHVGYSGTPAFDSYAGSATLLKKSGSNLSQIVDLSTMKDVYQSGGTPIDVATGDFWEASPGDEYAVIWDTPVSNIDGVDYYTIIIYDSDGVEVNRCGRSPVKWQSITSGDFIGLKGDEIAAIHEAPIDGKYPIYVFGRGRKEASVVVQPNTTVKLVAIAGGNFSMNTDAYDEIAFVREDTLSTIRIVKPTDLTWWVNIRGVIPVMDMAAGNFDGVSTNGDEIAVISSTSPPAYLYKSGASTYYATAGFSSGSANTAIAAGNFDMDSADEVALSRATAVSNEYQISCFDQGGLTALKTFSQNVQGVPAMAIAACDVSVGEALGVYERVQGFSCDDYGSEISGWGDGVAVLPSAPQTNAIPLFLLNADPDDGSKEYLKVVPIVK